MTESFINLTGKHFGITTIRMATMIPDQNWIILGIEGHAERISIKIRNALANIPKQTLKRT